MIKVKEAVNGLFAKIETREDAIEVSRSAGMAFFVVAAIHALFILMSRVGNFNDAIIYVLGGALIFTIYNRASAVGVLLLPLLNSIRALGSDGDINFAVHGIIIPSLLAIWPGIRAVQATFLLHGKLALEK